MVVSWVLVVLGGFARLAASRCVALASAVCSGGEGLLGLKVRGDSGFGAVVDRAFP